MEIETRVTETSGNDIMIQLRDPQLIPINGNLFVEFIIQWEFFQ